MVPCNPACSCVPLEVFLFSFPGYPKMDCDATSQWLALRYACGSRGASRADGLRRPRSETPAAEAKPPAVKIAIHCLGKEYEEPVPPLSSIPYSPTTVCKAPASPFRTTTRAVSSSARNTISSRTSSRPTATLPPRSSTSSASTRSRSRKAEVPVGVDPDRHLQSRCGRQRHAEADENVLVDTRPRITPDGKRITFSASGPGTRLSPDHQAQSPTG